MIISDNEVNYPIALSLSHSLSKIAQPNNRIDIHKIHFHF